MAATIMIDGYNLDLDKGTGVATYARNLSYEVHNLGYRTEVLYGKRASRSKDPLLREVSFFDPDTSERNGLLYDIGYALADPFGLDAKEVPVTGTVITKQFTSRMPYFDKIWNSPEAFRKANTRFHAFSMFHKVKNISIPDIAHWTYPIPMYMPNTLNIYTMHDLVPLRLPFTTLDMKKSYLGLMRQLVKRADKIVTVSESSRRDIIELLACPEDKVTNTYQSVEIPEKYKNKPLDEIKGDIEGAYNLKYKEYILFFGSIEPKKNIGRLIEAHLASQVRTTLVIVGAQAWKSEKDLRLLNKQSHVLTEDTGNGAVVRERIKLFEYASFELLVSLIRGAKAVAFPSLYEGFGLPVLEAMLLGTPVITSKTGSTPEVAGDAALMVDPYNMRELAGAIVEMDRNADLRADLSARGIRQAELYSPARYRERLSDLYEGLLAKRAKVSRSR
jgi:glycosyltransferase involved in cell wall biosynthesis